MNLFDRLKRLAQGMLNTTVSDLFGEGEPGHDRSTGSLVGSVMPDTDKLLKQVDERLTRLHDELAEAVAREKRAEAAWQTAHQKARALSNEVDALLKADQADAAHKKLVQLKRIETDVMTLEKLARQSADLTVRLKQESDTLEAQLKQVHARLQWADEREAHADLSEQRQRAHKAQTIAAKQAMIELEAREEEVAKRQDQITAQDEVTDSGRIVEILKRLKERQ